MSKSILPVTKDQLHFKKKSYNSGACVIMAAIAVSTVVLPSVALSDQTESYVLMNVATKRCLDSNNRGGWYGDAYTRDCSGEDFQRWQIYPEGDHLLIQNYASSFFIGEHRDVLNNHYVSTHQRSWHSEYHYGYWKLTTSSGNAWNLINTQWGGCLESDSAGAVYLLTCNNEDSQKWQPVYPPKFPMVDAPNGVIGWSYEFNLKAYANPPIIQYAVSNGDLPPGIGLDNKTGILVGTPTQSGIWMAEIMASNGVGVAHRSLKIEVVPPSTQHFDIRLVNMSSLQVDRIECEVDEPLFEKCASAVTHLDPGKDTLASFDLLNTASLTFQDSHGKSVKLNINPRTQPAVTIATESPNVHAKQSSQDRSIWKVIVNPE